MSEYVCEFDFIGQCLRLGTEEEDVIASQRILTYVCCSSSLKILTALPHVVAGLPSSQWFSFFRAFPLIKSSATPPDSPWHSQLAPLGLLQALYVSENIRTFYPPTSGGRCSFIFEKF